MALVDPRIGYVVEELGCDDGVTELLEKSAILGPTESRIQGTLM